MEGVAYSQWECVDVFAEMGVSIGDMMICGGGGRSPLWRQMLSDMYNCPISVVQEDEGPALGVAILAAVAASMYDSVESACEAIVKRNVLHHPIKENRDAYSGYYGLYKRLYRNLYEDFRLLSKLKDR
jgi:xylulokinase